MKFDFQSRMSDCSKLDSKLRSSSAESDATLVASKAAYNQDEEAHLLHVWCEALV